METQAILKQMTQNFPRWMDVRKRNSSSNGGVLLQSIAEEFENVNAAIQDYRDNYFLIRLIGREEEIIDHVWTAHIGDVAVEDIALTNPALPVTASEQEFLLNRSSLCLFAEGYLLFTDAAINGAKEISYVLNSDYSYTTAVNRVQLWNVFDEFAKFSGLTRREGENNKELVRRTLLVYSRPANSSEQGLKNAILNALPDGVLLAENDIVFDTDGASTLKISDTDYGTLYEKLAAINKDTWRTKEWRKSDWEHAFKELEYLPNVWDAEPAIYQDGTGRNNDLEVGFTSELGDDQTDVTVYMYERSNVRIQDYVRNNTLEEEIPMTLTKYADELMEQKVQFQIEASEAVDILTEDIRLESCKQVYGTSEHYLEDILLDEADAQSFTVQDLGQLDANTSYKLQFRPKTGFDSMKIISCTLDGKSILVEKSPYTFSDGILVNADVPLHLESVSEMQEYTNLKDALTGFTIGDLSCAGKAVIDIDGIGNQYVTVKSACKQTTITNDTNFVTTRGFTVQSNGSLLSQDEVDFCDITVTGNMSSLSFELISGNCIVTETVNGTTNSKTVYEAGVYSYDYGNATNVTLKVKRSGAAPLAIKNIAYASYNINLSLKTGFLRVLPGLGTVLPAATENNLLYIEAQSFSTFAPVFEFVHIGSDLSNAVYELPITTTAAAHLEIDSNCIVTLVDVNNDKAVSPYITKKIYSNATDKELSLRIDTSGFSEIESVQPKLYESSYGGETTNYITVQPGESIQKITITGTAVGRKQLVKLIDIIGSEGCINLYASKALPGLIKRTASGDSLVCINKDLLYPGADYFRISCPETLSWAFVMADGSRVFDRDCGRGFTSLVVFPKTSNEYIAYNTVTMVQEELKNQAIVDLFHPPLPANALLAWKVSAPTANTEVLFSYDVPRDWSIGKHAVNVKRNMSLDQAESYNCTKVTLNDRFKVNDTIELEDTLTSGGSQYTIAEYIIAAPAWLRVNYETREYEQTLIAESDGFNKLKYANVEEVISIVGCLPNELELLKIEGIIHWLNAGVYGSNIKVKYSYKAPVSMTYTDMNHLYNLAGYSIDAYAKADGYPKTYTDVADGQLIPVTFSSNCKLTAKCKNANFGYALEENGVRIVKTNDENVVYVNSGYYYSNGQEHYLHAAADSSHYENMGAVILRNVDKIDSRFLFHQKATNLLTNSSMTTGRKSEASIIDFAEHKEIEGVSALEEITACDSFAGWQEFGLSLTYVPALNGLGMKFTQKHEHGYAFLDITSQAKVGKAMSIWCSGIIPEIAMEETFKGVSLGGRAASLQKGQPMTESGGYYKYEFAETDNRVYLLVKDSGTIDDIVITDVSNENNTLLHKRVSTRFGFDIEERANTGAVEKFVLETTGNRYDKTDMASDKTIMTATNVDWGFTKIHEMRGDFSGCTTSGHRMAGYIKAVGDSFVTTQRFFIPNKPFARRLVVKVNDLHDNSITRITCYTADDVSEEAVAIAVSRDSNFLEIPKTNLLNYVEIKVDMPAGSVIQSVEAYAEYTETNQTLRIAAQNYGEMETKLYDIGYAGKLTAKHVEVKQVSELDQIVLQVRACRQDEEEIVWTEWKQIIFDAEGNITNPPVFDGYQFYCFKLALHSAAANILIDRIEFEVSD